jgi:hypothetical protein
VGERDHSPVIESEAPADAPLTWTHEPEPANPR